MFTETALIDLASRYVPFAVALGITCVFVAFWIGLWGIREGRIGVFVLACVVTFVLMCVALGLIFHRPSRVSWRQYGPSVEGISSVSGSDRSAAGGAARKGSGTDHAAPRSLSQESQQAGTEAESLTLTARRAEERERDSERGGITGAV
jgi:hypothetical protein